MSLLARGWGGVLPIRTVVGVEIFSDRFAIQMGQTGDSRDGQALVAPTLHLVKPSQASLSRRRWCYRGHCFSVRSLSLGRFELLQQPPMAAQHVGNGFSKIFEQMPAVSDLAGLGCATSGALGIGTTTIPADNLHPWMGL